MTLTYKPAADLTLDELAALFTKAFTGYITGSVQLDRPGIAAMLARENIDLNLSTVAARDDVPLGFGLIARQGWTSRLAGMGILPEAQGQQVGFQLLEKLIEAAKARQDKVMVLEAFEQNERAVKLYEKAGFEITRRLYGYTLKNPEGITDEALVSTNIYDIASRITAMSGDLPWQISGTSIARIGHPTVGYKLNDAYVVITDPSRDTIAIRAILVGTLLRRQGHGRRLLQALWAKYPDKTWVIPQLFPEEEFDAFFQNIGFERQELNQVEMRRKF